MFKKIKGLLNPRKPGYRKEATIYKILDICRNSGEYFTSKDIKRDYLYRYNEVLSLNSVIKFFYILEKDKWITKTGARVSSGCKKGRGLSVYRLY